MLSRNSVKRKQAERKMLPEYVCRKDSCWFQVCFKQLTNNQTKLMIPHQQRTEVKLPIYGKKKLQKIKKLNFQYTGSETSRGVQKLNFRCTGRGSFARLLICSRANFNGIENKAIIFGSQRVSAYFKNRWPQTGGGWRIKNPQAVEKFQTTPRGGPTTAWRKTTLTNN